MRIESKTLAVAALFLAILAPTGARALSIDASGLETAFVKAAERAGPAVVHISAVKEGGIVRAPRSQFPTNPFGGSTDPFELFEFFNRPRYYRRGPAQGFGSGVIVSEDGVIITNHHVAGEADRITVRLADGREYVAERVGTDPKTEICVLRIEGRGHPYAELADHDKVKVGQWALAIGNPFGLDHTVTLGIVSALGRRQGIVGRGGYEDFIQTDAAINPGNSGGPLVNTSGEVIGINTAIYSRSGGYMGVGFAVPSNLVKLVMERILKHGRVTRSWLGIGIQDVTPELAPALGLAKPGGVLVTHVVDGSPAGRAGLRRRDVVLTIDGREVAGAGDLRNRVAHLPPGTAVKVGIIRGGEKRTLKAKLERHPDEGDAPGTVPAEEPPEETQGAGAIGVRLTPVTATVARRLGLDSDAGLLVVGVRAGSPAAKAGLRPNDVIREAGDRTVKTLEDFEAARAPFDRGEPLLLLVANAEGARYVAVKPRK